MAIIKCTNPNCKNQFQDERYGEQKRVMNKMKTSDKERPKYRCTVCLTEVEK